jgi:tRNA threonylcarbamoyl adenosine modification protein (Sua5/YciO/YrdC/YwlC family)
MGGARGHGEAPAVSYRFDCRDARERERGVSRAAVSVSEGLLVVLPTDAAYGVGCDAFSPPGVELLGEARGRRLPPPVLVANGPTLDGLATDLTTGVRDLAEAFWPGGLTLVCRAQPSLMWDLGDTGGTVALRMPLHPVALALLERTGPLAVTGANRPGTEFGAVPTTCDDARAGLGDMIDVYLDAGPMRRTALSTVVDGTRPDGPPRVLRVGAVGLEAMRAVVPDLDCSAVAPPDLEPEQMVEREASG